ncbi:hypothetical protein [Nitratireductor indicus]|nr:hypothetical protein [Nitratireductor indicus]SFQ12074.1 hypothetical protein SAMN05216176_101441 [Nitratireductor indicus]
MWTALAAFAGISLGLILVTAWVASLALREHPGDDFLNKEDDWGM